MGLNVSAKTEYACIAVLELAARSASGRPVRIRELAEAHGIPARFLVQILLQLKAAGLVVSTRGAAGGYQLAKPADEITLAEVMAHSDSPPAEPESSLDRETPASRVLLEEWRNVAAVQAAMLESVSFADLAERARGRVESMYYI